MSFKDDYDFDLLINETENLVIDELDRQLHSDVAEEVCKCQDCVLDMATFALNKLDPKYRSSFTGVIYAQQYHTGEYRDRVEKIVLDAIHKISSNPSHDIS